MSESLFDDWRIVITGEESSSSVMVAFRFVGKSLSALSTDGDMGKHAFHRELEEFEALMKEILSKGDEKSLNYVVDCLAKSYKHAVGEPEEMAEEICCAIQKMATSLCALNEGLWPALQEHGRHGRILATYIDVGQSERRAFI